jgi:hypothetical protein
MTPQSLKDIILNINQSSQHQEFHDFATAQLKEAREFVPVIDSSSTSDKPAYGGFNDRTQFYKDHPLDHFATVGTGLRLKDCRDLNDLKMCDAIETQIINFCDSVFQYGHTEITRLKLLGAGNRLENVYAYNAR